MNSFDFSETTGHAMAFYMSSLANAYEYDPAADGPETDVIKRIRAKHALYAPGKEGELLKFQYFVDSVARHMYGDRYGRLGKKRQLVVLLHLGDDLKGTA